MMVAMRIELPPLLDQIVREMHAAGYRAVVVGGAVRDALLGGQPKDFDIEVYGIAYDRLAAILARHGRVDLVGKSFGVVKLVTRENQGGHEYDFSVPRRDSKFGLGHRDFQTTFDNDISPREAASRRDFTINAIAYDPVADEVLDFFGGAEDLKNRVLRATSEAFAEDPLRVLRGMQFACRFDLTLDPGTAAMCRSIVDQYGTIARERVAEEFMKWAVKSVRPGRIAEYLADSGWDVHFPEIARLTGVPQDPGWHPEGDVGTHTMLVVDAAARISAREKLERRRSSRTNLRGALLTISPKPPPPCCASAKAKCAGRPGDMKPMAGRWRGASSNASASRARSSIAWSRWSKIIWRARVSAAKPRLVRFGVWLCVWRRRRSPTCCG